MNTVVVTGGQTRQPFPITGYPTVSDPGPYPIPLPPIIEGVTGGNYNVGGDKHLTIIDKDNCLLYETYNTYYDPIAQTVKVSTSAVWDLLSGDHQRPYLWVGGSVAGLPWSFHALRYDEVASGQIKHALTFAARGSHGRSAFTDMATAHQYGMGNIATLPPFGARARLKAGFDITKYPPRIQVILKALKQYGMVYIDGSMPIDMHVEVDDRWNWTELNQLRTVMFNATNFEFVKAGPIYNDPMYGAATAPPAGPPPVIGSFTASSASVAKGTPVTLTWSVTGASSRIRIVTPSVGPVVTNSVVVTPAATTTYTLAVENVHGISRKTVTVNVVAGSCAAGRPAVAVSPASHAVAGGQPVSYLVSVTNTDSAGCAGEPLALSHTLPAGWTGTYSPSTLTIPPGGSATATLTVVPPGNAQPGANPITIAVSGMGGHGTASANAQFAAGQAVSLTLSTVAVTGGATATGTVTIANAAPAAGAVIALSDTSGAATTPASVTIAAGATSRSFAISTVPVSASTAATVTASYSGLSDSASLRIDPPMLNAITLSPASLTAGASSTSNTVTMTGPVPAATAVSLASSNPAAASVPSSVTIPAGASSASFTVAAAAAPGATGVIMTASHGGITKTANLALQSSGLYAVSLSPATVVGGVVTTGNKVILSAPASANTVVTLTNANLAVSSVPSQVVIPAGATSATFAVTTHTVSMPRLDAVFATLNGVTKSMNLTVNPASLASLSISPATLIGGASSSSSVVSLDGPAGGAGVVVALTSARPLLVSVPATVTVPAGATSVAFAMTTSAVAAPTTVIVTATYGAIAKTATLTLNPVALSWMWLSPNPAVGGSTTTYNSVTLIGPAGPGGAAVALSSSNPSLVAVPAAVMVPAGVTTSPNYAIATTSVAVPTTVTVTASYGGVTRTASLTLNPPALAMLSLPVVSMTGGTAALFNSVLLNGPAGPAGAVVSLSSSNPAVASLPATAAIAPGASKSSFTINTARVPTATTVAITATYAGVSKTVNMTVNP